MPYNGSGTFNRLYSWVVDAANSINISSTRTDAEMNGIAAGLTNCITRDGQSPPSADLPMGGKKLTNLGVAAAGTDALSQNAGDARYLGIASALPHTITFNSGGAGAASGAVFDVTANITVSFNTIGAAPLASPTFTGTPAAPTAAPGTNTTQLATTGFVAASFAPLASPTFTGIPAAPTAAPGTNTTQVATTAFVAAGFASPAFTGNPTAPTPSVGDNDTSIATTAFVQAAKAPVIQSVTSAATVTPTFSNDAVNITAQAAGLTLANWSGSAVDFFGLVVRLKDNGGSQTIAYGGNYLAATGVTLPSATTTGKTHELAFVHDSASGKHVCISAITY